MIESRITRRKNQRILVPIRHGSQATWERVGRLNCIRFARHPHAQGHFEPAFPLGSSCHFRESTG